MSWDIELWDDRGHCEYEQNYTHNVNSMIAAAFKAETGEDTQQCGGPLGPAIGPAWWQRLDGMTGIEGRDYLTQIVHGP